MAAEQGDATAAALLEPDEPSPVEVVGEERAGPFVILCDHASRALPRALGTRVRSEAEGCAWLDS